ncbi:MAG TPA: SDR family oxidoreductase [Chitinophagaceae bacterium]|nr:SDR family oxidoreductase [Chitinophagales bacterium]HNE93483.1 SDR family oxidoreductase [Chitinophagaceae bacterium]HNL82172.1 SDR family oxidoreductase [Chitinophagaceae bacterium]
MGIKQFSLDNKTILITGASGDLGAQTAITLSEAGANVVITGRNELKLKEISNKLNNKACEILLADLTNEESINELAKQCPKVDGVVHAAGVVELFPTKFINKKKIDFTFNINFVAPVLLMTALFRNKKINNRASIVFISSLASEHPYASGAMYSASKAAIEAYSKTIAAEHANIFLRSNSIAPAIIKTKLFDKTEDFVKSIRTDKDNHEKDYLFGYGEPSDVSNLVLFLLSEASKWITGETIPLDGGYLRGLMT